jgi:hypothetical protein
MAMIESAARSMKYCALGAVGFRYIVTRQSKQFRVIFDDLHTTIVSGEDRFPFFPRLLAERSLHRANHFPSFIAFGMSLILQFRRAE